MGYFRRKLRRGVCARDRDTMERARIPALIADLPAERRTPHGRRYIRFQVDDLDLDSLRESGIFVATYTLLRTRELSDAERANAWRTLDWFRSHLPAPRSVDPLAIFWF